MDGFWVGEEADSPDSDSDETKRAEWVLGFAQKMDIRGREKPFFGVEYPFRYSLPLVAPKKDEINPNAIMRGQKAGDK